jgi:hypothetical protein
MIADDVTSDEDALEDLEPSATDADAVKGGDATSDASSTTTASNIQKSKHDTVKNSISNIR